METEMLSFFDFENLTSEERQKVEYILDSATSAVQLPWNSKKLIPLCMAGPSHYFTHDQMTGHAIPAGLPVYPCPAPSMVGVPVLTYPHGVVFNAGAMYMPMVHVASTLSSNGIVSSVVPMAPTLTSGGLVSSNLPYQPVTLGSGSSAGYPTQPMVVGPMEAHFSNAGPALVTPHVLHDPVMHVTSAYLPCAGQLLQQPVISDADINNDAGKAKIADLTEDGESQKVDVETGLSSANFDPAQTCEDLTMPKNAIVGDNSASPQSSVAASKPQTPSMNSVETAGEVSKVNLNQAETKVYPPTSPPPAADTRRSSVASEASASGDAGNVQPSAAGTPKPKSWASLLHNTTTAANAIVVNANDFPQQTSNSRKLSDAAEASAKIDKQSSVGDDIKVSALQKKEKHELMVLLKNHAVSHRSICLQPRGLANHANWCYVNATLQALLACPPFYHLIKQLSTIDPKFWEVSNFPAMKCMAQLVAEFPSVSVKSLDKQAVGGKGGAKVDIRCGNSFEPVFVHKMLQAIDYEAFKMNQQEDAEEFLSCILNRLHDEMVNAMKQLGGVERKKEQVVKPPLTNGSDVTKMSIEDGEDGVRWEQVRSRNRTVYSNTACSEFSPIAAVFRGQFCCIFHQSGQKESATLQPFFTLPLDVQNEKVKSVQDALEQLVSKESLLGYTCAKSNVEVDATQRTLIEELPSVLVLHLKWFHYDKNGLQKRIKQVDFDIDMELSKDLLASHSKARNQAGLRKYKLFAVVSHIGARAIGGHYIVDVFHAGYNCWIRCDDSNISYIPAANVTKFTSPKVPYLIFYRRFEQS